MSTNEAGVEPDVTRQGKFISLLCLGSIGVLCSLVQLYHLLFTESLRRSLSNHVLIGLLLGSLLTSVIDLPPILIYLYEGRSPVVTFSRLSRVELHRSVSVRARLSSDALGVDGTTSSRLPRSQIAQQLTSFLLPLSSSTRRAHLRDALLRARHLCSSVCQCLRLHPSRLWNHVLL